MAPARTKRKKAEGDAGNHAVLYARVSSKEQEIEGFSIPAQTKLLLKYAEDKSLKVAERFTDIETAGESGRSAFTEMLNYFKANRNVRALLVEKTDRLYRNFRDVAEIQDLDLELHFVKEHEILTRESPPSKKMMHGIQVVLAKGYIDNLSEETRKGMLEKAAQGIYPSYAPPGYRNVMGPEGKKIIEPDPELAPLITMIYEWYATGNLSIRQVAALARDAGMVTRKSKAPVRPASIHQILRNRTYTGDFDWKSETYTGIHIPLVSRELWEKTQTILDRRNNGKERRSKRDFAFSRLMTCGHCGCALVGQIQKKKYIYYHCTGFKQKCPEPYTREEVFEERFGELLEALSFDEEVLGWATEALRLSHEDQRKFHEEAIARLQRELKRYQDRIDAMYIDKLDGRITAAFFDRKAEEWRNEEDKIRGSLEEHQKANRCYIDEGVRVLEIAHRAPELFRKQSAREKRRLLDFVLSNSSWREGELSATYRQPFDLIAETSAAWKMKKAAGADSSDLSTNWLLG